MKGVDDSASACPPPHLLPGLGLLYPNHMVSHPFLVHTKFLPTSGPVHLKFPLPECCSHGNACSYIRAQLKYHPALPFLTLSGGPQLSPLYSHTSAPCCFLIFFPTPLLSRIFLPVYLLSCSWSHWLLTTSNRIKFLEVILLISVW